MIRRIVPFFLVALAGCSSSSSESSAPSDAARVFTVEKAPAANSGQLTGVWESQTPQKVQILSASQRFEFRADHLVFAQRCSLDDNSEAPVTVGGRASADVSESAINVKEPVDQTQRMGTKAACGVKLTAGLLPACDPKSEPASRKTCFLLSDGALLIYQAGVATSYVKLAD